MPAARSERPAVLPLTNEGVFFGSTLNTVLPESSRVSLLFTVSTERSRVRFLIGDIDPVTAGGFLSFSFSSTSIPRDRGRREWASGRDS